ncbi:hypothetical protein E2C01_057338 [Portunus trituberculatus]|uniref:Uncharacterized protein n=1 Tax=Portunus trituberculatus TaxID=210409 RepID=A0A5B7GZR7_PORTR|nr:hypothetical protein [Portunus trituberculatus]
MRHEKSGAPTYWPAAELFGTQFEIASGAQFENALCYIFLCYYEVFVMTGYSVCSKQNEGREEKKEEEGDKRKEHHVEEVIKLLRAISLHHGHSIMVKFLEETVLEK